MAKPTFIQSLFNKPTKSYAFPPSKKEYHSQKKEFLQIATAAQYEEQQQQQQQQLESSSSSSGAGRSPPPSTAKHNSNINIHTAHARPECARLKDVNADKVVTTLDISHAAHPSVNVIVHVPVEIPALDTHPDLQPKVLALLDQGSDDFESDDNEMFFTPTSSPRASMISPSATVPSTHTAMSLVPFPDPLQVTEKLITPLIDIPRAPPPLTRPQVPRQDSVDSVTSTTATTSAADFDKEMSDVADFESQSNYSLFSLPYSGSDSTRLTTPVTSDAGHYHPSSKRSNTKSKSVARSLLGSGSDVTFTSLGSTTSSMQGPDRALRRTKTGKKKGLNPVASSSKPGASVDENWAKDVRWLVTPPVASSSPGSAPSVIKSASRSVSGSSTGGSIQSSSGPKRKLVAEVPSHPEPVPVAVSYATEKKAIRQRKSKSLFLSNPSFALSFTSASSDTDHLSQSSEPIYQQLSQPQPRIPPRRAKSTTSRKNKTVITMGALVEVDEPMEASDLNLHHTLMGRGRQRSNSLLHLSPSKLQLKPQGSRSRVSSSPSKSASHVGSMAAHSPAPRSQYTSSSRTVTLPTPLPIPSASSAQTGVVLPSSGTPGFTSLVLPRAGNPGPSKPSKGKLGLGLGLGGLGQVDLTKGGMAQTTMATVEVVRGIAKASVSASSNNKAIRRKTLPRSFTLPSFLGGGKGKDTMKSVLLEDESPLAFTSWRKPPGRVGGNGVLVQVWAVGLDAVDEVLVKGAGPSSGSASSTPSSAGAMASSSTLSLSSVRMKTAGKKDVEGTKMADVGFIPGRSFVGRVVECGWEVKEDQFKKNDWVVGLMDIKKCGAMAEFVIEDRRRLQKVPYPRMPTESANPNTPTHGPQALTLEELALLPITGLPAHRALRTFAQVEASCVNGILAPRVLILRGHDGVGAMAVRMFVQRGWSVTVHVPVPSHLPEIGGIPKFHAEDDKEARISEYIEDTEELIRSWGADEVLFVRQSGDNDIQGRAGAIRLMDRLREDGEEFDGVLDTLGGKEVWDAGETLLSSRNRGGEAQFTTVFGDSPERIIPTTSDLFKAGARSTKSHGMGLAMASRRLSMDSSHSNSRKSKERTKVGYAWVIINQDVDWQDEDVAASLRAAVRGAVIEGGARPLVAEDKVVPFENSPGAFIGTVLCTGGTVVIKVVG